MFFTFQSPLTAFKGFLIPPMQNSFSASLFCRLDSLVDDFGPTSFSGSMLTVAVGSLAVGKISSTCPSLCMPMDSCFSDILFSSFFNQPSLSVDTSSAFCVNFHLQNSELQLEGPLPGRDIQLGDLGAQAVRTHSRPDCGVLACHWNVTPGTCRPSPKSPGFPVCLPTVPA